MMNDPRPEPIHLPDALDSFDQLWSPRVALRMNNYDVRVAKVAGEHVWHAHDDTDEFFLVLDGELRIDLRDGDGEREVVLRTGSAFVVPRGQQHRPTAPDGASILMFEPSGTLSTGDHDGPLPDHIDATTGHALG
jgi:mannose-6-phosphate isomerase-like protein (cupin superfamily)